MSSIQAELPVPAGCRHAACVQKTKKTLEQISLEKPRENQVVKTWTLENARTLLLHGPMALIEPGFPVVVIAPSGVPSEEMRAFIDQLHDRSAETIAISDDDYILSSARIPFALPQSVPEWLSPLTTIVPGQLFSLHLATARDFDVDSPRGLRKVTETR